MPSQACQRWPCSAAAAGSNDAPTLFFIAKTCGYLAPEYGHTLSMNEKGHVCSYGVVLLELFMRQKPLSAKFEEGINIVKWARSMALIEENILHIYTSPYSMTVKLYVLVKLLKPTKCNLNKIINLMEILPIWCLNVCMSCRCLILVWILPLVLFLNSSCNPSAWMRLVASLFASSLSSMFAVSLCATLGRVEMILVLQLALRCLANDAHM
ncbi:hypothetical protein L7F22_049389 [Adiantum nelumboides]|nr:hypothetical protein [Adiantum nelumboides]